MAGKTNITATYFAQKKLLGKANTSILKKDYEESISTNIQTNASIIFGETVTDNPTQTLYWNDSIVEYVEFELDAVAGTAYQATPDTGGEGTQDSGTHAYRLKFPTGYAAATSSGKSFQDGEYIHEYLGRAQLVPTFYSELVPNPYNIKLYDGNGVQIPLADEVDWSIDYYNGILFLQDYDANKIPATARAFIYIGDYLDDVLSSAASSGDLNYVQSTASGYLSATGSMSFSGGEGYNFNTSDVGSDTFFFVSGSLDGQNKSVFGGDVVVSGSFSLSSNSLGTNDQEIRHQFIDQEYSGSYITSIDGQLLNKSLKSPVYAKSSDINSDLFNVVRMSLFTKEQASFESLLQNTNVFKIESYVEGPPDSSGNPTFTKELGYFNFSFDKDIGYLKLVTDPNTGEDYYENDNVDNQNDAEYFFDTQNEEDVSTFQRVRTDNGNIESKYISSLAADVKSNFNHGFKYIIQEYDVNDKIANDYMSVTSTTGISLDITYTPNSDSGVEEITGLKLIDSNSATIGNYDFSSDVNIQNEPLDITKKVLNDINDRSSVDSYRSSIVSSGVSVPGTGKIINRYPILFSRYLNEGTPEYIKIGTKVSVNRWESLKSKYSTFDIDSSLINGVFKPTSASNFAPLINATTAFGCLKTFIYAFNYAVTKSSATTKPAAINSTNYPALNWTLYNDINNTNSNSGIYELRLLFLPFIKKFTDDLYDICNTALSDPNYSAFFGYTETVKNFSNNTLSSTASVSIEEVITNKFLAEIGYNLNKKVNGDRGVYTLAKEYDEYLYYTSLHFNSVGDRSERDFVQATNRGQYASGATTTLADYENSSLNVESLLKNRYTLMTAFKPALIANGTSLFLGPVSISKLYGQSPIQVNTEFVFGNEQPVLDDFGNVLTGSDGNILTSASHQLVVGSKGFEGDLQVTGSVDITGFGRGDGMRINMGSLVMTSDLDGSNMPQFQMINSNANEYERPQILLSNNLSSFVSGSKSYQMGEIAFAGPRDDSPEDDRENIVVRAQINELVSSSSVNYLSFDFYVNEARNPFKNADGTIPVLNQRTAVLALGQFSDGQADNENGVSTGMGVRGNVVPLGVADFSDIGGRSIPPDANTLGTERFRWGALHLSQDAPLTFGNTLGTKAKLEYDSSYAMPVFSGSAGFLHGLSGSLTTLLDGTSYLRGIDGVTVSTGSSGEVYVGLEGYTTGSQLVTTDYHSETGLSGSQVSFNQDLFELANYNDNNIKFYLNGQLLSSGSVEEVVVSGSRDYHLDPDTGTISFASPVQPSDILASVYHNDTSDERGQYRYDRILSIDQAAGTNVWFNFDFRLIDYSYDKFEVFVNGQQLTRIEGLSPSETQPYEITAVNRIAFDHDLYASDVITLLFKIPNPFASSGGGEEEGEEINFKIKETRNVTQDYNPLDPVSITDLPFALDVYSNDVLTVYLNGQLLYPGNLFRTQTGRSDYYIQNDTTILFADVLKTGDVITFDLLVPGSANAFDDTVFITQNRSLLSNTLQLSGSNGIELETTQENIIIKNNKELVFNEILGGNADGINRIFYLNHEPFASSEISIFVDGQLKVPSGSTTSFDYQVTGDQITFNSQSTPSSGSLVMSIYNKVI